MKSVKSQPQKISSLARIGVITAFLAFLLDQISKILADTYSGFILIDGFFHLSITGSLNPVFAFSIPAALWVVYLVVIPVFVIVVFTWIRSLYKAQPESVWIALVIGGAAGNFIDRLQKGGVYDWIELAIGNFTWSSFNLADVFIVVGALGWLVHSSRTKQEIT